MTRIIYMYGCLAHKIQLVIQDALRVRQVEKLVFEVKNIVRMIFRARFRSVFKAIPLDNATRWSSCYHMIKRYIDDYDIIQDVLQIVNQRTKMGEITMGKKTLGAILKQRKLRLEC